MQSENVSVIGYGDSLVMLSAPHNRQHSFNGEVLPPESYTEDICREVAFTTGSTAIYFNSDDRGDANKDSLADSLYKQVMIDCIAKRNIQYLFDIHGMRSGISDVEIGTMDNTFKSFNNDSEAIMKFCSILYSYGFTYEVNGRFKAVGENTVSRQMHELCGVASIQIEVSKEVRYGSKYELFVRALSEFIEYLKKRHDN